MSSYLNETLLAVSYLIRFLLILFSVSDWIIRELFCQKYVVCIALEQTPSCD